MELRDYQLKAKHQIYEAWNNGAQNVMIQMSTGSGKTVLFSNILSEEKQYAIAIAHRMELVAQMSLTLARYGIRHNVIAQKSVIRGIIAIHMAELKRSYYDPKAKHIVAGIDTLIRTDESWFKQVKLIVQDEGHHTQRENKWGRAARLFPNARGLYPTATPARADGRGLSRKSDGLIDTLIIGPPMLELINRGFLTGYVIHGPNKHIDLSNIPITAAGDYSPPKLRNAMQKAKITGDVVNHYLKFAKGKLGITFAVSIEAATEIAAAYREAGITSEVITGKTPDMLRNTIMRKFRNREILQLVNVDILGEGVDVPAIEVVSMARPTCSYAVYAQQFGRALRSMEGKKHAIILDHVDNVMRHGLPDALWRTWTLERRERRTRGIPAPDVIPIKYCLNPECLAAYERIHKLCPFCGMYIPPSERSDPQFVDGDLTELTPEVLAIMRGEVKRVDDIPRYPSNLDDMAKRAIVKRHYDRQTIQQTLRKKIALWAGFYKHSGKEDSEIYRRFYFTFNIDIMGAQSLGSTQANALIQQLDNNLSNLGVVEK